MDLNNGWHIREVIKMILEVLHVCSDVSLTALYDVAWSGKVYSND